MMKKHGVILSIIVSLLLTGGAGHTAWAGIQAVLESPGDEQLVSGILPISGWAFADDPGNPGALPVTIRLFIDNEDYGEIPCCVERGDVRAEHGEHGLKSGFGQVFNFGLLEGMGEGSGERGDGSGSGTTYDSH